MTKSGCVTVSKDNAVVQNLSITDCTIEVNARNVTIRNVKILISARDAWAIHIQRGASATIENVEISGRDTSTRSVEYAVLSQSSSPVTVTRSNLYNCADCIQGENMTVTRNYIHDMANPPGAHVDGFQCNSNCGVTITGNTILNSWTQTSTIALFADFGTPRNSTISGNLLAGGGYAIYGGTTSSTGIKITNNRISRIFFPNGGHYGPVAHFSNNSGNTWTGNIWDDTGKSITR